MAARKKVVEATSEQTLQWISQKFVGKHRKAAIEELSRLEAEHGRLVPSAIVDAARSPKSPLHRFFEWDNTVAAEKYRIMQASNLIRHVKVVMELPNLTARTVRAYVSPYTGQGYVRIEKALSDADMRMQLLAQARRELEAFRKRYNDLEELNEAFKILDTVLNKPAKKKRRAA